MTKPARGKYWFLILLSRKPGKRPVCPRVSCPARRCGPPAPRRVTMLATRLVKPRFGIVPLLLILTVVCVAQAPRPVPVTDQETELGQQMYQELRVKGEIIESSP